MKQLLTTTLLLALLAACQKETSTQQPTGEKLSLLETGTHQQMRFNYNAAGLLSSAIITDDELTNGEEVRYDVRYAANGKMSEVRKSNGQTIRPLYDEGMLVKAELYEGLKLLSYTEYAYLNGHLKQAEVKIMDGTTPRSLMKIILSYDALQQPIRSSLCFANVQTGVLEPAGYVDIKYDDRKNPIRPLSDFMLLLLQLPGHHNVVQEKQYDAGGTLKETRDVFYRYNNKQMPAAAQLKTTIGTQVSIVDMRYHY